MHLRVVLADRLRKRWGLTEPHVARDDCAENLVLEVTRHFLDYLVSKPGPYVVHGEEDAANLQLGIQVLLHPVDGLEEKAQSFEGKIFALQRDDDEISRNEPVQSQEPQRRRTVDEDVVEPGREGTQGPFEEILPLLLIHQLNSRPRQVDAGRDDGEIGNRTGLDGGGGLDASCYDLVDTGEILLCTDAAGGVRSEGRNRQGEPSCRLLPSKRRG